MATATKRKKASNVIQCAYCGKVNPEGTCMLFHSATPNWVLWAGGGKTSCPDCYEQGKAESERRPKAF